MTWKDLVATYSGLSWWTYVLLIPCTLAGLWMLMEFIAIPLIIRLSSSARQRQELRTLYRLARDAYDARQALEKAEKKLRATPETPRSYERALRETEQENRCEEWDDLNSASSRQRRRCEELGIAQWKIRHHDPFH
jgi:hypothetical protein